MRLSSEILITERQIRERVAVMAAAIAADTADGAVLSVLAVLDGAFMFCSDLVRHLPMRVHLALAQLRSVARGGDPWRLALPPPAEFPVEGADVLVVEDILDSGKTLAALRSRLLELGPERIRIAVLLDKPHRREAPLRPDYVGFAIPDRWVVGYGLDSNGLFRNLPYISYVE